MSVEKRIGEKNERWKSGLAEMGGKKRKVRDLGF